MPRPLRTTLAAALLTLAGGGAATGVGAAASAVPTYELLSVNSRERAAETAPTTWTCRAAGGTSSSPRRDATCPAGTRGATRGSPTSTCATVEPGTTRLVSLATNGRAATGGPPSISPNGRFVAFCSYDPFIVRPDSFDFIGYERDLDVFVRDLRTGVTRRASTDHQGKEADHEPCLPHVADNGDTVFASLAGDLVEARPRRHEHPHFLYDWSSRKVRFLGEGDPAPKGADISGDARYVAFLDGYRRVAGDKNPGPDVYLLDRRTNRLSLATDRASGDPLTLGCAPFTDLSYDGRFLLVACNDGAIVDPPVADGNTHLVVLDRRRDRRWLVNPSSVADPAPDLVDMSDDGRTVTFVGHLGSFGGLPADEGAVDLWRRGHDLVNLTPGADDIWSLPGLAVSGDGSLVAFTTDSRTISDQDPEDPHRGLPQQDLFGVELP